MKNLIYTSDVSIEDHSNFVVFKNSDGDIEAIHIERDDNTETFLIYNVELFNKPSDSWINKDDLKSMNESCDTNYEFDTELNDFDKYLFSSDLCWYFGANNLDNYSLQFNNYNSFIEWLKSRNLI